MVVFELFLCLPLITNNSREVFCTEIPKSKPAPKNDDWGMVSFFAIAHPPNANNQRVSDRVF